jgi:hypothetical protein
MGLFDRALLGAVDTGPLGRGRKFQPALDGRARQAAMDGRGACLGRVGWRGGDAVRVHGAAASSQQPAASSQQPASWGAYLGTCFGVSIVSMIDGINTERTHAHTLGETERSNYNAETYSVQPCLRGPFPTAAPPLGLHENGEIGSSMGSHGGRGGPGHGGR